MILYGVLDLSFPYISRKLENRGPKLSSELKVQSRRWDISKLFENEVFPESFPIGQPYSHIVTQFGVFSNHIGWRCNSMAPEALVKLKTHWKHGGCELCHRARQERHPRSRPKIAQTSLKLLQQDGWMDRWYYSIPTNPLSWYSGYYS